MRLTYVFVSTLALVAWAIGQQTGDNSCPTISVDGPSYVVKPGEVATYTTQVNARGLNLSPTYKWSVSAGSIISGQGTEKIEVRTASWNTTVTVEVQGLPLGCPNLESETAGEGPGFMPIAMKIAKLQGPLSRANFDSVVKAASREPHSQLYVILSGASRNRAQSIRNKRNAIMTGLGQLNAERRITLLESTRKDDLTVIWLVPPGATPPLP